MHSTTTQKIKTFIFAALLACACKESPPPAANLSAPPPMTVSGTTPSPALTAQAEVKASSGPVELTLLLHQTRLKPGDSLWYQLRIRNVSDEDILITDTVFSDPWRFYKNLSGRYGLYLEVLGPDGKRLPLEIPRIDDDYDYGKNRVSGLLNIDGPQEQAMVDRWKLEGLSESAVNHKLVEYNHKKLSARDTPPAPGILKPGESIETKSWFHHGIRERMRNMPETRPIGDFAELEFFHLDKRGNYKVRAVYDWQPTASSRHAGKKYGLAIPPEHVIVRTAWIEAIVSE